MPKENADQLVPMIPGVRWEICLQIQVIKINLGLCGDPPNYPSLAKNQKDFPGVAEALRAGRVPDYSVIDRVLAKKIPRYNAGDVSKPRVVPIRPEKKEEVPVEP